MRLRRSAISNALATSTGQMAGTRASAPAESRSRTVSVNLVASSSKHQATATDASSTKRLVAAAFINELAYGKFSQSRARAQPPDGGGQSASVFFPAGIGRRQFSHRNSAPRDLDGLAHRSPL